MAPSRFSNVSPFKNVQANIAKKEAWLSELPLATTSAPEPCDGMKATDKYTIARGSSAGSLVFLPHDKPGKYGQKAATWNAAGRSISDFDTSWTQPLVAAASEDGRITVARLPDSIEQQDSLTLSLGSTASLSASAQKAIEVVQFHPTTSDLLLSMQGSRLETLDLQTQSVISASQGCAKGHWSASWSHDGKMVQTTAKDNTINLWDVRQQKDQPAQSTSGHQGFNKASRITSVGDMVFTTGFSKMRDRECSLWDPRNFSQAVAKTNFDTNTGVLIPLVDHARKIVYLAGRADMTLKRVEVTGETSLTAGMPAALPTACLGAAILPATSQTLNVMQAEIGKIVLLGADSVVPVTMQIPRRNYLDFYDELFPPVEAYLKPAHSVSSWQKGEEQPLQTVLPKPKQDWCLGATPKPNAQPSATSTDVRQAPFQQTVEVASRPPAASEKPVQPVAQALPATAEIPDAKIDEQTSAPTEVSSEPDVVTKEPPTALKAVDAIQSRTDSKASPIAAPKTDSTPATISRSSQIPDPQVKTVSAPSKSDVRWSRNFLAGKTALKPDYEDVHGVATTKGAAVQLLKASQEYFFYPLGGPGGRLAVHPIASKGRLPTHAPTLATGSDIVDFALDPFDSKRAYIACSDGKIHAYDVPTELGGDHGEARAILADGMDKLYELHPHPNVKDLLLSVSDDKGKSTLRVWNAATAESSLKVEVSGNGIHSAAWDTLGSRVAVTCKDKKIRVFDPRSSSDTVVGAAHDSVRPSKVVWADDEHLLTCGFTRSAFRELALHQIQGSEIVTLGRQTLDISPAPLFPHYDQDTNILFVYSKGERICHAFEINVDDKSKLFTKLPGFEDGSLQTAFAFSPKQAVDVKKVEVAHAWRLTPNTIQSVSFSIPRAKSDYFQDDIFPHTLDRQRPSSITATEWLQGRDAEPIFVDLQPEGLPKLSQAPPPPPKTKQAVMKKQMTDEESQKQYLDSLFQQKQDEVDSDEDDMRLKRRDQLDDDDW